MPDYSLTYRDRKNRPEMNGAKWEQLVAPYRDKIDYNPERIWKNWFVITCPEPVALQISSDHPELVVEQVTFASPAKDPATQ